MNTINILRSRPTLIIGVTCTIALWSTSAFILWDLFNRFEDIPRDTMYKDMPLILQSQVDLILYIQLAGFITASFTIVCALIRIGSAQRSV